MKVLRSVASGMLQEKCVMRSDESDNRENEEQISRTYIVKLPLLVTGIATGRVSVKRKDP